MSDPDCATINQLSQSWFYNALLSVKLLIAACGVAVLLWQWKQHGARFLGHFNSRALFHCYYMMFVVHGTAIVVMYTIDLSRGLVLSALLSSHIIFILMSIERLYSSLFPENFEKSSAQRLTVALASSVVASVCLFVAWCLTNRFQLSIAIFVSIASVKVEGNADKYDLFHYVLCATSIVSLMVFFADIYLNFYRKLPDDQSLGFSYQFSENRRVIRVLVPIEIVDSMLTLSTAFAQLIFATYARDATPLIQQIFLESTTFMHAYPLLLAIIIKWRVEKRRNVVQPVASRIDHFKSLEALWA